MSEYERMRMIATVKWSLERSGINHEKFEFTIGTLNDMVSSLYRVVAIFKSNEDRATADSQMMEMVKDRCYAISGILLYII